MNALRWNSQPEPLFPKFQKFQPPNLNTIIKIIAAAIMIMMISSGCAMFASLGGKARYGSEKQYEDGVFWGVANSNEMAKIKRDKMNFDQKERLNKLSLKKLEDQAIETKATNGTIQGYEGVIENFSNKKIINIIIGGDYAPETKGYVLQPKKEVKDYLLPGDYTACTYYKGERMGHCWNFSISPQKHTYLGKSVHWYVYYED